MQSLVSLQEGDLIETKVAMTTEARFCVADSEDGRQGQSSDAMSEALEAGKGKGMDFL